MTIIISILVFFIISILLYFGISVYLASAEAMRMRLKIVADFTERQKNTEIALATPLSKRILLPLAQRFATFFAGVTPREVSRLVEKRLQLAGGVAGLTANEFIALAGGGAGFLLIISFLLSGLFEFDTFKVIGVCFYAGAVGLVFPFVMLFRKVAYRQASIQRDLPNVLDLITISVEAGLSFDGALAKLTEKMKGTLVDEFSRVLQEMRMGVTRRDALKAMSDRCGNKELALFVSALVQADQLGVRISNVLRVQSVGIREKRKQQIEQKANKAPVFMLFPIVTCIFPALFIVLIGPAVLKVINQLSK